MKAIGEAIKRYASGTNSEGEFDLDGLVRAGCLTREQTVCGSSGLGISNYIVARPSGLERPADETIVLYEPLSNHGNEGGNFLYGDGHVMFNRRPLYDELVGEVARADR
jgi:prepilin-type processing-associated H-X9-DG protein